LLADFTPEDQLILARVLARGDASGHILAAMFHGGNADDGIMFDLVEETMYNVWSERQRAEDELLDQQRWDAQDMEAAQYDCDLS